MRKINKLALESVFVIVIMLMCVNCCRAKELLYETTGVIVPEPILSPDRTNVGFLILTENCIEIHIININNKNIYKAIVDDDITSFNWSDNNTIVYSANHSGGDAACIYEYRLNEKKKRTITRHFDGVLIVLEAKNNFLSFQEMTTEYNFISGTKFNKSKLWIKRENKYTEIDYDYIGPRSHYYNNSVYYAIFRSGKENGIVVDLYNKNISSGLKKIIDEDASEVIFENNYAYSFKKGAVTAVNVIEMNNNNSITTIELQNVKFPYLNIHNNLIAYIAKKEVWLHDTNNNSYVQVTNDKQAKASPIIVDNKTIIYFDKHKVYKEEINFTGGRF